MTTRFAMAVDTVRCVGCNACVIACKTENAVPEGGFRDWIAQEVHGAFPDLSMQIRSERCNHCAAPSCVDACPTGASHVAQGGVVAVARNKCTGCKACIAACPYGARYVHPEGYVDKCTFCLHRVTQGRAPACVETCPTRSLTFGDLADPDSPVSRLLRSRRFTVLREESGNRPQVFFLA
ncbi:4Fe-4S dicluster domain-containing protein [Anaeromyxobacter paludicola]|uniref:4Fe-4S ferredoxin n=1 Tax=Anaeromyxobacter paludicola TaxID=2918171 RepID=A0ABN6NB23_9BACT|nr:4Fe-4S dicluster domain-containing protein [Anaeromyxobacter paludicola]BDG09142.1 4Fe-4S ferredoxin [Anaeromyxobacter paludicola]